MYTTANDVTKHGHSEGCNGCNAIKKGKPPTKAFQRMQNENGESGHGRSGDNGPDGQGETEARWNGRSPGRTLGKRRKGDKESKINVKKAWRWMQKHPPAPNKKTKGA